MNLQLRTRDWPLTTREPNVRGRGAALVVGLPMELPARSLPLQQGPGPGAPAGMAALRARAPEWSRRIRAELAALGMGDVAPVELVSEDGAVAVILDLPDRRFGIWLDHDDDRSSWYFVSRGRDGVNACGSLRDFDLRDWLRLALGDRGGR